MPETEKKESSTKLPAGCVICPNCSADWRGADIFEALKQVRENGGGYIGLSDAELKIMAGHYGWTEENKKTFSRLIGIERPYGHPERYDGVSAWRCPDCNAQWPRF